MTITLNGDIRPIPPGCTISELLNELKLDPKYLAVEVNRRVISRRDHAATVLEQDDRVEIVTLVGGG